MANVIYRGPVEREPETINLPVAAALNPGVAVKVASGKLAAAADTTGRWLILGKPCCAAILRCIMSQRRRALMISPCCCGVNFNILVFLMPWRTEWRGSPRRRNLLPPECALLFRRT